METPAVRDRRYRLMDLSYIYRYSAMKKMGFPELPAGILPSELRGGELERRFLAWVYDCQRAFELDAILLSFQ